MKVGVLGAGAFGIALANILVTNDVYVDVWTHSEEEEKRLSKERTSDKLKGFKIPKEMKFTCDLEKTVKDKDLIVMAIPAFAFEEVTIKLKEYIKKSQPVLIATKGIQQNTCLFLNDVFSKYLKNSIAVISGPTFAIDMVNGSPIAFSLATKSKKTEMVIRNCFENGTTKFRRTKDITGVEICGSIKNVMAIASGMLEGMGVTDSTRAFFLTESMNDIKELIEHLGGRKKSIHKLIKRKKVKMPIINLIHDIINGKKQKEDILKFLIEK